MIKIGGAEYKISDDGNHIMSRNSADGTWRHYNTSPGGKKFTEIRVSKSGMPEYKCDDGDWYDNRIGGGVKLSDEQKKLNSAAKKSNGSSNKKGSLAWRITKGIFKFIGGFILFSIGLQSYKKD